MSVPIGAVLFDFGGVVAGKKKTGGSTGNIHRLLLKTCHHLIGLNINI
jgi:hypothetical protein